MGNCLIIGVNMDIHDLDIKGNELLQKKISLHEEIEKLNRYYKKSFSESIKGQKDLLYRQIDDVEMEINLLFGIDSENWQNSNIPVLGKDKYELWVKYSVKGHCYNMYKAAIHPRNFNNPYSQWFSGYTANLFLGLENNKNIPSDIMREESDFINAFNKRQELLTALKAKNIEAVKNLIDNDMRDLKFMESSLEYLTEEELFSDLATGIRWAIAKLENKTYTEQLIQEEFSFA